MQSKRGTREHMWRYLVISVIFCVVCFFYIGKLFYVQISGKQNSYQATTTTRVVSVPAVRGEIFDRNGKKLVSNSYAYDLIISHATFSSLTPEQSNRTCLSLLSALDTCNEAARHTEAYFPFEGVFPYYYLSDEAATLDSIPYYRMVRIISDLGLDEDTTPQELIDYYVSTYRLLATDGNGRRLFSDNEIDRILRLRYDMDAKRFNASNDYVFAASLPSSSYLIAYVSELSLDGADFRVNVSRIYEYDGYASHILGSVGPIYSEEWDYYNNLGYQMNAIVGKSGCELAFEEYLHGTDGKMEIEIDSTGKIVGETVITQPIAGKNVYLTIDIDLQIAAEDGLAENVQYVVDKSGGITEYGSGCNAGAAVAMDPKTFDVLAIASHPTYSLTSYNQDYNAIAANPAKPLINRALSGLYEPGSTFKLGIAVAALMEGEIDSTEKISCYGEYPYGSQYAVGCSTYGHDSHTGAISIKTAISQSCNTFFCELGNRLGISRIEYYMAKFGFGEETGLELGNKSGVLAGPTYRQEQNVGELWMPGNTWHASIGQSDNLASPLQLACYTATLANGGTRYSAHLLHSVYEFGQSEPVYVYTQTESSILDTLDIPENVQATVFAGMRDVVTSHASIYQLMNDLPVEAGGKTGTAQTSSDCNNALFVGTAPYHNPEIVVSVVLEQGYAGTYASRTASAILHQFYGVNE